MASSSIRETTGLEIQTGIISLPPPPPQGGSCDDLTIVNNL